MRIAASAVLVGKGAALCLPGSDRSARQAHDHLCGEAADPGLPMQLDLRERVNSAERQEAGQRIAELQRIVGTDAPVRIEVGSVKEPLLEAALRSDADVLIVGRSPRPGVQGRMRYLTYAMVRDSPFHVLSI
jgi:nucleotide-binding universal stress UspA family protein